MSERYVTPPDPAPPLAGRRGANAAAQQLTGRDHLSWSQIELMRRCPRRFAYAYAEGARGDFVASSLLFGSAFHAAVARLLKRRLERETVTPTELRERFRTAWAEAAEAADASIAFARGEDAATLQTLAERMFAALLASPFIERIGTVCAVERTVRRTLADDLPDLVARMDAAWTDSSGLVLAEFKTARSRWSEAKARAAAAQLLLYRPMVEDLAAEWRLPVIPRFLIVPKTRQPVVQALDVGDGAVAAQRLVRAIRPLWRAMRAGHFYPVPSSVHCPTCPFRSRCPAGRVRVTVSAPPAGDDDAGPPPRP